MPRVRPAPLVAALATALALAAAGPVAPGPAAAAPPVDEAERALDAVERRVAELARRMSEQTRAYEDGRARLGVAQSEAVAAERAVEQAEAAAGEAGAAVREAVRVRYRNPTPAGLQVLLELQAGRLGDALAVRTALARVHERAERDSDAAVVSAAVSVQARVHAEAAREQVVSLGREQDERLRALQDEALAAERELTAAVVQLDAVQEADRRSRQAARAAAERAAAERAAAERAAAEARAAEGARRPPPPDPLPAPAARGSGCGATGPVRAANGLLPDALLCPLATAPRHRLVPAAAAAYDAMSRAHQADTGRPLCLTDSYRSYGAQVDVFRRKPGLAAVPGTSNHGWGRAVDLCGGAERFGTAAHRWLQANGPRFGWTHPAWAGPGGSRPEPWHWEHPGS